ncbi:uncharacterized protein LOC121869013 [Homarus americanus]|uniref:uncharacterized protein LOC121869013 n=1 Tax=Homarus americanus TaxID=6706 RepID=UPI001C4651CB|nr:uncharacterized protein LOC121869013 [Homarus americanus]
MAGSGGGVAADDTNMAGFRDRNSRVVGTWKIIECVSLSGSSEATGIEGTEFVLSEAGDVTWTVTDGCDALPLFSCQMYEVYTYQNLQCYGNRTLLRFAAYNGHIIEFRLDQPVMSRDLMLLTYDGWFMLQCEKLATPEIAPDLPYSLLPALTDGYFSDITITAKSGRKFEVHSIILQSSMPSVEWTSLCGLDDSALETILYYLYSCCLPSTLTVATAHKTIAATQHLEGFEDFRKKCDIFIKNTNLRNRLVCLMQEVQECVEVMVQLFNPSDPAVTSPTHLITVLKAALRQMAIGVVKVVELSQEFEQCGWRLTQAEQHEVMRYTRSQLPRLLATVVRLLANVRASLAALNHHTRQQLAQQLVPEISSVLQTVCVDVGSLRTSLEHIIQASSTSLESAHSPTHLLAKSLRNDLHLRELQKLRILQENLTSFLNSLVHKREQFEEIGGGARVRGVARIIEHFTEELPVLTLRLEEAAADLEEIVEWSEFKFVFKGATSKVGSIVERLVEHRGVVESLVAELVERVGHPAFTTSLQHLGLLAPLQDSSSGESPSPENSKAQELRPSSANDLNSPGDVEGPADTSSRSVSNSSDTSSGSGQRRCPSIPNMDTLHDEHTQSPYKLSLVSRVCEPPPSRSNPLAVNIARLLADPVLSDMTFVIVPPADDEASPSSSQEELDVIEGQEANKSASKESVKESSSEWCELQQQPGTMSQAAPKMSSTVVRKVKKSLSLDRPSVRATMPSQAYSLDCDAMTCSDNVLVPNIPIMPKYFNQHHPAADFKFIPRSSKEIEITDNNDVGAKCDDNVKLNVDEVKSIDASGMYKTKSLDDSKSKTLAECDKTYVDMDRACKLRHSVTPSRERCGSEEPYGRHYPDNHIVRPVSVGGSAVAVDQVYGLTNEAEERRDKKEIEITRNGINVRNDRENKYEGSSEKDIDGDSDKSKMFDETHYKIRLGETDKINTVLGVERLKLCESPHVDSGKVNKFLGLETQKKGRLTKAPNITGDEDERITKSCSLEIREEELLGTTPEHKRQYSWEIVELQAHRVVAAARCEWFRRALLSGMREAIDRCIVVHGCSVQTFQLLLGFLYAGHVECSSLPPDQLVDLLVLADHYGVDALKLLVESGLEQHVDDDSVVPLLTVAHHCNATHLKEVCVHHCVVSAVVLEGETLGQLPEDLRQHLTMALGKHRKWCSGAIGEEMLVGGEGTGGEDSPLSVSSTDPLTDDQVSLIPGLQYGFGGEQSVESSNSRVESVVQQLREIVGQQVPRSRLVQITLAADYDVNRALNFFFASSS